MKSFVTLSRILISLLIIFLFFSLSACGGIESTPSSGQLAEGEAREGMAEEENTVEGPGSGFEDVPLPEGFPPSFPIPEGSRIGLSGEEPVEGSFQIVIHIKDSLERTLDYFRQSLPANGWTLIDDEAFDGGHGLTVSNDEFEGEMYFLIHEEDSYVDVSLDPQGSKPDISDVSENFGVGTTLGESETDFPADFPLPVGADQIDLSNKLAEEGYQLAFSYPDILELAYIQFSAAIVSSGWMIGDFQMGANSYTMPFSNPNTGFEGYALLTSDPQAAGVSSISGCIVAFHPASYP